MEQSNIERYLEAILKGVYGRDVRQAIHDAIQQCYDDSAGGIAPVITTAKVALGTEVTVTVGSKTTKFTVLNGVASEENVKTYINAYLDEHPEFVSTVADGSVSPAKTSFFARKQVGEPVETYTPIVENDVLTNANYSCTAGYYISTFSIDYNIVRMTESTEKVSIFRKVKAGETVTLRGGINSKELSKVIFINEENYNVLMAGYQASTSALDSEKVEITDVIHNSLGQIRLNEKLLEIWPEKGSEYANEITIANAPFDGYIYFNTGIYNTTAFSSLPTYEYSSETMYGYTLEENLKSDPFIGDQMTALLNLTFDDVKVTPAKFDFSAMTDAIAANTDVSAVLEKLTEPFGTLQYVGGICANKKIYCSPNTADNILVYDTENEYYYKIATGLGNFAFKYTGFVTWNGYLYAIPRGVNNFLRVDPVTDEVTIIELDTKYLVAPYGDYRDSHHYNGVISDNGYMYCPPAYSSDKLLKINMNDFTFKELDFISEDVSTWIGCVKHPTEDKIIFLSTKVFRVWDCVDDTYTDIVNDVDRACYDMVYDPRFNCFVGVYPNHVFVLNLTDNSIIDSDYVNYVTTGYGICLGVDGKYYHLEGASAFVFSFDGTAFTQEASISTSESVGTSTPVLAGQAIANNGDIYGIPASGSMTRLKFSGVTRKIPDYIVSSQYYGKY